MSFQSAAARCLRLIQADPKSAAREKFKDNVMPILFAGWRKVLPDWINFQDGLRKADQPGPNESAHQDGDVFAAGAQPLSAGVGGVRSGSRATGSRA